MSDFKIKSVIHDYDVKFIDDLETSLISVLKQDDYLIIDNKVKELFEWQLENILKRDTFKHICIHATEEQKSYEGVIPIIQYLIEGGFRKNHRLIAIGGGITQDVTAFIASIMYRGVSWIFYPTTLLAQCDSCIGSKTSINFRNFKNQIGGFYPPEHIYIWLKFLETLSKKELLSGLGEMLHYYIVSGEDDFKFYRDNYLLALTDKTILSKLIARSLAIKKGYIEVDEFDRNVRQVFNYGHSFGHAIESLTNYQVPHGIAVSYGMDMSNFISVKLGLIPASVRNEIREVIKHFYPDFPIKHLDVDVFLNALSKDKKNVGKKLGLILNKGYGKIFKNIMDKDETFCSWIKEYFEKELNF